jgi:hypothetical protein
MPIDTDSEVWKSADTYDPITVEINSFLSNNKDQAFSIREIEEHLLGEHQHLFPNQLVGDDALEGAKAARQSIIANILEYRYWRSEVTFQYISGDRDSAVGLYFTWDGVGISPIAELDEVSDPNPDSPFGTLSSRFRQIESDLDEEVSELEERLSHVEYRLREELDTY